MVFVMEKEYVLCEVGESLYVIQANILRSHKEAHSNFRLHFKAVDAAETRHPRFLEQRLIH
jgi:hypothetical protein